MSKSAPNYAKIQTVANFLYLAIKIPRKVSALGQEQLMAIVRKDGKTMFTIFTASKVFLIRTNTHLIHYDL